VSIDQTVFEALDLIYAAATDESLWPDVIRRMVTLADSQAISFCVLDSSNAIQHPIFHYLNIEKRSVDQTRFMEEYLAGGMMGDDPTVQHIVAHPEQRLVRDSILLTEREKDRLGYYAWHGSFSDTRHRMAGMISPAPHIHSGITLHRTRQMGDFENRHVEQFLFLLPHIERAVNVGFQLGTLGAWRRASTEIFDANTRGIIFLGRDGSVLFANKAACAIAASSDGVVLSRDGMTLLRQPDDAQLRQLMRGALDLEHRTTGVMRAARPSGKRHYSILVAPLSQDSSVMAAARPVMCVVITDPESQPVGEEDRLRKLFGFTRAEARLAARLAHGEALQEAAAALNIAYGTARTQLAVIFRKTETNRQGELVRLLLADVPSL
jgi:DNA-binding CsgD family transcriptional regulator/PAS domain-containing protein